MLIRWELDTCGCVIILDIKEDGSDMELSDMERICPDHNHLPMKEAYEAAVQKNKDKNLNA